MSVTDHELVQYLEAALWLATDDNGDPLDQQYGWENFSGATQREARAELEAFWSEASRVIGAIERAGRSCWSRRLRGGCDVPDLSSWPHDFWLTRNRHGIGFWDREEMYGEAAEPLAALAHRAGERYVAIDRRVLIHWEGNEAIEEENVELYIE